MLNHEKLLLCIIGFMVLFVVCGIGMLIGMESGYIERPKFTIERFAEKDGVTIYRISNGRYYGVDANGNGFGLE
jgi:hypothetical protein